MKYTSERVDIQNKIVALYEDEGDFEKAHELQDKFQKAAETNLSLSNKQPKPKNMKFTKKPQKNPLEIEKQKESILKENTLREKTNIGLLQKLSDYLFNGQHV